MEETRFINPDTIKSASSLWSDYKVLIIGIVIVIVLLIILAIWSYFSKESVEVKSDKTPIQTPIPDNQQIPAPPVPASPIPTQQPTPPPAPVTLNSEPSTSTPEPEIIDSVFSQEYVKTIDDDEFLKYMN